MSADYHRANSVTVCQDGQAYFCDVVFEHGHPLSWYKRYRRVSSIASLRRLAAVINSIGMQVELDDYGVPTWTRKSTP